MFVILQLSVIFQLINSPFTICTHSVKTLLQVQPITTAQVNAIRSKNTYTTGLKKLFYQERMLKFPVLSNQTCLNSLCFCNTLLIITKCTINGKIIGTPKGVYLPISKLHSILTVANLLAHNNLWLCYYGQVNLLWIKLSVVSKWASKFFGGTIYFAVDGTSSCF